MHQPTIEKLHALRLGAMANALTAQLQQEAGSDISSVNRPTRLGRLATQFLAEGS
jgi:hypothetical protein